MQSNQPDMRADDKNKKPVSDKSPALMLMRVLQGALIGGGAILPGVSGGVLAVVFGIYRPMMELLSHPFRALKKNLWLFIPIIIGDNDLTFKMWRDLFDAGVFVNPVISPATAPGRQLLRTSYMATHTRAQLERVLETFAKVGRANGLI